MCQPLWVRVFVTGFGPFGGVEDNPSSHLASTCGLPFRVLEVSFAAVEEALVALPEFDALLMIGVAGNTKSMRLESVAHNWIGGHSDVRGAIAGPGPIDPKAPFQLHGNLWSHPPLIPDGVERSVTCDAGGYLCNYALFRAIQTYPCKQVGFLHVPVTGEMPLERQSAELARILDLLQAAS